MITEIIIDTQIQENIENCERQLRLYEAIRLQISLAFFSRTQIDEEELLWKQAF